MIYKVQQNFDITCTMVWKYFSILYMGMEYIIEGNGMGMKWYQHIPYGNVYICIPICMNNTFGINDAPIGDLVLLHVMFHVHLQVLNPYVSKFKQH